MSQRILILPALLLAAGAVFYFFLYAKPPAVVPSEVVEIQRGAPPGRSTPAARESEGVPERGSPASPAVPARPAQEGTGSLIGLRVPEGMDLSDPEQVHALLVERLTEAPTDWKEVARLVALYHEPLDAEMRARLLRELVNGRRGLVLGVFQASHDGTLVTDLLAQLDDETVTGNARSAVLTALATLPGADPALVVRGLEARLSGDLRGDAIVLQAIGQRGGAEAARAITDYIAKSDDPLAVASRGTLRLDLKDDAAASKVLSKALREARSDEALGALIRIATQPGAKGVVESLVALDASNVSGEVRGAVLRALAVIGTENAVTHVLETASRDDETARTAIRSLGVMSAADAGARTKLLESLDASSGGAYADERRLETLRALSNLKHVPAEGKFAEALGDRDPRVQEVGVQGLGRLGEVSREHVGDLVHAFGSGGESLQRSVVIALGQIGGEEAAGVLRQLQADKNLSVSLQRAVRMAVIRAGAEDDDEDREERLGGR